jgi:acyl carrier protein
MNLSDLTEIFEEVIDLSGVQVVPASVLGEDILLDSREMLRILSKVEARCGIRFEPTRILRFKTVGDILEAVSE